METGLVTYAASIDSAAIQARRRVSLPAAIAWLLINADDAHPIGRVGRPDLDLVPDAVADQRLTERRFVAHAACLRVDLRRADDSVCLLILAVLSKADRAPHRHQPGASGLLDQDVVLDDLLQLIDPRLHETLLVFGGVVFEVLGEVAELAGGFDFGCDRGPAHVDEVLVLLADRFEPLGSDVNVLSHQIECRSVAGKPAQRCIGPFPPSVLFGYSPRHEKGAADGFDAPDGYGARGRRRRIPGRNVPGPARPGSRYPRLRGRG